MESQIRHVLVERPAGRDGEHLATATDTQDRLPVRKGKPRQRDLHEIAFRLGTIVLGVIGMAVEAGVNIPAAHQQKPLASWRR
jgi:hypothetical protein